MRMFLPFCGVFGIAGVFVYGTLTVDRDGAEVGAAAACFAAVVGLVLV